MGNWRDTLQDRHDVAAAAEPTPAQIGASVPDVSDAANGAMLTVNREPNLNVNAILTAVLVDDLDTASGGTITITFDGDTTTALNAADDELALTAAVEALSSVGAGNVLVAGPPTNGLQFQFQGDLGSQHIAEERLAVDGSGLTGPDEPYAFIIATAIPGSTRGPAVLIWSD